MAGFDPTHAVRFELPRGRIVAGGNERSVVLPCAALDDLVLVAGNEAAAAIGRAIGATIGVRIATRLGGATAVRGATLERVVSEIAGELAIAGLGVATIERWGRALVVAVHEPAVRDLPFLASIIEGMIEGASGAPARCAPLGRESGVARTLVASEAAASRARAMIEAGIAWPEVVARIQAPQNKGAP